MGLSEMNERCQGALEALSYMRRFISGLEGEAIKERALAELDELIGLLLDGSVRDFRHRIGGY